MPKRLKGEGKVSRHQRTYKKRKIYYPRLTITSPKLAEYGFDVGSEYVYYLEELDDGQTRIIIEPRSEDEG